MACVTIRVACVVVGRMSTTVSVCKCLCVSVSRPVSERNRPVLISKQYIIENVFLSRVQTAMLTNQAVFCLHVWLVSIVVHCRCIVKYNADGYA